MFVSSAANSLFVAAFALGLICSSCSTPEPDIGAHHSPNLYGEDDRFEWHEITEALGEERGPLFRNLAAESTAVVLAV